MPTEVLPIVKREFRGGWLGLPEPFEVIDLLGFALGSYFLWNGVTKKGPQWLTVSLGAIMMYIHSQRFFYAPQTKAGLINLMQKLEITPEEIEGIQAQLK